MSTAGPLTRLVPRTRLTRLGTDVLRGVRGHDLALYAAGVTFYAAIAAVPLLLLSVRLVALVVGTPHARDLTTGLAQLLPTQLGARDAARWLSATGASMPPLAAVAALLPAGLYGEGLVRAFDRLSRRGDRGRRGLRGRLGTLGVVVVSPALLLAGVSAQSGLRSVAGTGLGARLLGLYVAFLVSWVAVSLVLAYCYRTLAPEPAPVRAVLWGAFTTGSFVAGTSLGWLVFAALGLPLGQVYGGSAALGAVAATGLWLYVLHGMVLVGYCLTLSLSAREGHPLGPVVEETALRPAA